MTTGTVLYFVFILLNLILLLWWRYGVIRPYYKFPTRGHIVLLMVAGCVPILNIAEFLILMVIYCIHRAEDDIELKESKFNKFWFDTESDDK